MADQKVEEQSVDNDAVEPGKGGDVVDVVKDGQAAGDDHAGDVSVKEESSSGTDWKAEARKWESRAKSNFAELEKLRIPGPGCFAMASTIPRPILSLTWSSIITMRDPTV